MKPFDIKYDSHDGYYIALYLSPDEAEGIALALGEHDGGSITLRKAAADCRACTAGDFDWDYDEF